MDASKAEVVAALVHSRAELREVVAELDRAVACCQQAKWEALETLADLDTVLDGRSDAGR